MASGLAWTDDVDINIIIDANIRIGSGNIDDDDAIGGKKKMGSAVSATSPTVALGSS